MTQLQNNPGDTVLPSVPKLQKGILTELKPKIFQGLIKRSWFETRLHKICCLFEPMLVTGNQNSDSEDLTRAQPKKIPRGRPLGYPEEPMIEMGVGWEIIKYKPKAPSLEKYLAACVAELDGIEKIPRTTFYDYLKRFRHRIDEKLDDILQEESTERIPQRAKK